MHINVAHRQRYQIRNVREERAALEEILRQASPCGNCSKGEGIVLQRIFKAMGFSSVLPMPTIMPGVEL